jgi:glutamine---fructose-6-phosphate transaminase (isomerizing)
MCGIIGCLLKENSGKIDIIAVSIKVLNLLKNRGYDSCGIYINNDKNERIIKKIGIDGEKIKMEEEKDIFKYIENQSKNIANAQYSIGHSRWATHGGKTDDNSHPHLSMNGKITVVHNGIISNYIDLKKKYLNEFAFVSETDTEVISNLIQYFRDKGLTMLQVLEILNNEMEGTWGCLIRDDSVESINKIYFMKNENPVLIGESDGIKILTSEPSGFLNMVDKYILLREKTYGYIDKHTTHIVGDYKTMDLIKSDEDEIELPSNYDTWLMKEIDDQRHLSVLEDPIGKYQRYNSMDIFFNLNIIKKCKYLYIIGCGSSYYAGLIASNYFRFTKAFEFVNVIDGGEFTKAHLETIENPEEDLLVLIISQSGETRDLNLAVTICREFSSNRKEMKKNKLLNSFDPLSELMSSNNLKNTENEKNIKESSFDEIKIIGIINVIGSLISRRTIDNIYTNTGRENSVASTKSCTSQILICLLLAIYKSKLNDKLNINLEKKFKNDLTRLQDDIDEVLLLKDEIKNIAINILEKNNNDIFILGKDELHGVAMEGALKIKEVSYIHAEGFNITALKHGPYALLEEGVTVIIIYKKRDHFIKSIVEEIRTRKANIIEISPYAEGEYKIKIPDNKTFTGLLATISLQILSYYLSTLKGINPDRPRNLAKVVTVD